MTKKYLISVPNGKMDQVDVIKTACEEHGVKFSTLMVQGLINEFENGGWAELIKRKEE